MSVLSCSVKVTLSSLFKHFQLGHASELTVIGFPTLSHFWDPLLRKVDLRFGLDSQGLEFITNWRCDLKTHGTSREPQSALLAPQLWCGGGRVLREFLRLPSLWSTMNGAHCCCPLRPGEGPRAPPDSSLPVSHSHRTDSHALQGCCLFSLPPSDREQAVGADVGTALATSLGGVPAAGAECPARPGQ